MFKGSEIVYYLMYLVGFGIMMVISLRSREGFGISKKDAVIATLITYVAGVLGAMIMGKIFTAASLALGSIYGSRVAIFGAITFTPIMLLAVFKLMKKDAAALLDMLTPGIFTVLICAKFGCFLNGCCCGIPCDWGVYNPTVEFKAFPVQLFEVAAMIAMVVVIHLITGKTTAVKKGMHFPFSAMIYCVIRFFFEEARYYQTEQLKSIVLGLSFWQIWCIILFIVCLVIMIINRKITANKTEKLV